MTTHKTMQGLSTARRLIAGVSSLAISLAPAAPVMAQTATTRTPIQHVIVIIGENHSFDQMFGTYTPATAGQTVSNILSKGIVTATGAPGPNFALAAQKQASQTGVYQPAPTVKTPYRVLPPAMTQGAPGSTGKSSPPFTTVAIAASAEPYLLSSDLALLTTGATGLPSDSIDTRVPNATALPNGPYPTTNATYPYDAYRPSPVHRFYQMWQETDCAASHATTANPSGCLSDLFPWVETTTSTGGNGGGQASNFTNQSTGEGSAALGFLNMAQGDVPYFKSLADQYTISDNFHQSIEGGTGANHIAIGSGLAFYYESNGQPATPPSNQIENPNSQAGTNNHWVEDGYSGGSYSNCSDPTQPGVGPILSYLASLPYNPASKCAPNAYYLLNNYNPGFFGDGTVNTTAFTIPPVTTPTIADVMIAAGVPVAYYGAHWNDFVASASSALGSLYCNICNPFLYETSIMTNPTLRTTVNKDVSDFDAAVANGTLPALSIVKPDSLTDGHPASSKEILLEAFTKRIIQEVQANPTLWATTAIVITFDESGGYWDSGYIQPVDFFGDGVRIPTIVVSPFSTGGKVSHTYADQVSIAKFVEFNWGLSQISPTSRDNLPNPTATTQNPYVPTNSPAIGDLTDMFTFQ